MIEPPCYAVIFSSLRRPDSSGDGYAEMGERMLELAALQPGYLGVESARGSDGFGITVSYWSSLESIAAWRAHAEHRISQTLGRKRWGASAGMSISSCASPASSNPAASVLLSRSAPAREPWQSRRARRSTRR